MNTKTGWQLLGSLALCISSSGCHGEHSVRMQETARDACADYGGLTVLLAEATIACTGTIGPDSFEIDGKGVLQNRFAGCTSAPEKENLEKVTNLLKLQNYPASLPRFQECLTGRYKRWSDLFTRTKLKTCPTWTQTAVFGEGDKASNKQQGKMQPKLPYVPASEKPSQPGGDQQYVDIQVSSKSSILYQVSYAQPEAACDDAAVCAAQCAAFLPGFVVSAAGTQVLADPASWLRDRPTQTCSTVGTDDPWCPPDFVHQMSLVRTSAGSTVPPGDVYGNPNRGEKGEHCTKWFPPSGTTPGFNYETDLGMECVAPGDCLSRCGN